MANEYKNILKNLTGSQTENTAATNNQCCNGSEAGSFPALFKKVKSFKSAEQIRAAGLYPYFRTISSAQDTEVIINGKKVLMLGSNSY
ncbi:MAG TPA: hypothetical protein PLW02_01225, partial [Verrucomicrobiota bacterium]|nr:hypothetical protein [Verrucomicrobiota bacterium]